MPEHFAFIGSDDPRSPGSVLLWSEGARILFNCPEGCQRFFGEISERLVAVSHVFFTQFTPHHTMGFPGMLFTINDAGVQKMITTSPSLVSQTHNNTTTAHNNNNNNDNDEQDAALQDPVQSSGNEMDRFWGVLRKNFYSISRVMNLTSCNDKVVKFPSFSITTILTLARNTSPSSSASADLPAIHSYLVQGLNSQKFDVAQAKKLGVNPGRKFSQLKSGETVESDVKPGVFITPDQVLVANEEAEAEERNVLLVDYCSSANDAWSQYSDVISTAERELTINNNNSKKQIHTVIHLARFPGSFLVHKMMQNNAKEFGSVSAIEEMTSPLPTQTKQQEQKSKTSAKKQKNRDDDDDNVEEEEEETDANNNHDLKNIQVKGLPLFWTEKIRVSNSSNSGINSLDDDDAAAIARNGQGCCYYIRRHIIAPNCVPPDSVRVTAFPTSLAMRMHLKAVTPDLFTDNSVSIMPAATANDADKNIGVAWPYGPSCFIKLRIPKAMTVPESMNADTLFRFPNNHLILPNQEQAMEMISPELRSKFEEKGRILEQEKSRKNGANGNNKTRSPLKWLSFGGTGSAVPNKYRNVSSIAMEYFNNNNNNNVVDDDANTSSNCSSNTILCDCGEGSTGQFSLVLGANNLVHDFIPKLKFIFISHMHADHHFGLFSFLSLVREYHESLAPTEQIIPLPVVAPRDVHKYFLDMMNTNTENNSNDSLFATEIGRLNEDFYFIDSEDVAEATSLQSKSIEEIVNECNYRNNRNFTPLTIDVSSLKIKIFAVEHPGSAHGIRLDFSSQNNNNQNSKMESLFPRSLIYTGDTRPTQSSVNAINFHNNAENSNNNSSYGVDVLIHESTFDSSMKHEAFMKMHCTVDEAISVATGEFDNFFHVHKYLQDVQSKKGNDVSHGDDEKSTTSTNVIPPPVRFLMLNHFSQRYPKLSAGTLTSGNTNSNTLMGSAETTMMIGASCDLLFVRGDLCSFQELQDSLPYFAELLEEYDKFAGGGSLSRRLRNGMSAIDKTCKKPAAKQNL